MKSSKALIAFFLTMGGMICFPSFILAQTWFNASGGAKIFIGKGTAVTIDGNLHNDSASVIKNSGIIGHTDVIKNYGTIELSDTGSFMTVDSILELQTGRVLLNSNELVIYSSDSAALQKSNGILVAENYRAEQSIKWYIGPDIGKYFFPFNTGTPNIPIFNDSLEDITVKVHVIASGTDTSKGYIAVSTYPTMPDNKPYPANIQLTDSSHKDISDKVINRFWKVKCNGYTDHPIFNLTLKYTDANLLASFIDTIDETRLKAQRWTGTNWDKPVGAVDTANNLVKIDSVSASGIWVLVDSTNPLYVRTQITAQIVDQIPGQPNTGSITIVATGGQAPYSVLWYDDDTEWTKENLNSGVYPVKVIDALNDTVQRDIKVDYQIIWNDTTNVEVSGNSIEKLTTSVDYDALGSSKNILPAGEDGYIEFTGTTTGFERFFVGLCQNCTDATTMEHSFQVRGSYALVYESGNEIINTGNHLGNTFRIARVADTIKYFRSDSLIWETLTDTSKRLKMLVGLGKNSPLVDSLRASFDIPFGMNVKTTDAIPGHPYSGAISLEIYGGKEPYTIMWSDADTATVKDSLDAGTYNVTVIDDNEDTLKASIDVLYQIIWKDTLGVTTTGTSIAKTGSTTDYDAGGSSKNYLKPGADGYVEFSLNDALDKQFYFGLSEQDFDSSQYTIEFAFKRSNDSMAIVESGRVRVNIGTVITGDRFRIERTGDSIRYYKNNQLLRVVRTDTTERLLIDVSLGDNEPSIDNIRSSFDVPFGVNAVVTDARPTQSYSANIELEVLGGNAPYTFSWSDGNAESSRDSLHAGFYFVTVTDADSNFIETEVYIGYKIFWRNIDNAWTTGNSISKTTTSSPYDAGASSLNRIPLYGNGYVEVTLTSTEPENEQFYLGLSESDNSVAPADIDCAMQLEKAQLTIREKGTDKGNFGEALIGDKLRIERSGDSIIYSRNGVTLQSKATDKARELFIDVSLGKNQPDIDIIKTNIGNIGGRTLYWVGAEDTLWSNVNNWSYYSGSAGGAGIPDSLLTAVFDSAGNVNCYLDAHSAAGSVVIGNTYTKSLNLNGFNLSVVNNMDVYSGTVETDNSLVVGRNMSVFRGEVNVGDSVLAVLNDLNLEGGELNGNSGETYVEGDLTVDAGTFDGGVSGITVMGNLSLYGGSFTGTSDTLNLYGNFTDTLEVFTHNDGSVIIRDTIWLSGNFTFHDLEIADSNRVVLRPQDTLTIESRFRLNKAEVIMRGNLLALTSGDTTALTHNGARLVTSRLGFSNKIKWHVGNNMGTYEIPFYTYNGEDIALQFQVQQAGDNATGYMEFSTYATSPLFYPVNNMPYPDELQGYYDTLDTDHSLFIADRYWLVKDHGYSIAPLADLTFRYTDDDLGGTNFISEDSLWALRWNGTGWDTLRGSVNTGSNRFTLDSVSKHSIWVLADSLTKEFAKGTACEDAILINDTLNPEMYHFTDTVMWFYFTASNDTFDLGVFKSDSSYLKMSLYGDSCENLSLLKEDTLRVSEKYLPFQYTPVTVSEIYYLRFEQEADKTSLISINKYRQRAINDCDATNPPIYNPPINYYVLNQHNTGCNLICNPEMVGTAGELPFAGNIFDWGRLSGSPNVFNGGIDGLSQHAWMWSYYVDYPYVTGPIGESIYAEVNMQATNPNPYLLSLYRRVDHADLLSLNVYGFNTFPIGVDGAVLPNGLHESPWTNLGTPIIVETNVSTSNVFDRLVCPVNPMDLTYIDIYPLMDVPPELVQSQLRIDQVELIDDDFAGWQPQTVVVNCFDPTTLGKQFCDVSNTIYRWTDQSGNVVGGNNSEYTFTPDASGTYTFCLERSFGIYTNGSIIYPCASTGIVTKCINVIVPPIDFTWEADCDDLSVTFTTSSSGPWHWDFGDNGTSTTQNPVHNFPNPGIYNVCLTSAGCRYCDDVTVTQPPAITLNGSQVCSNVCETYSATPAISGTYQWSIPTNASYCGSTPTGPDADILWLDHNGGTIGVTVTDANGCTADASFEVGECCPVPELTGTFTTCSKCRSYIIVDPAPGVVYTWDITGCDGCTTPILSPPASYTQEICWETIPGWPDYLDDGITRSITVSTCPEASVTYEIQKCCKLELSSNYPKWLDDGWSVTSLLSVQGTSHYPFLLGSFPYQFAGGLTFINGTFTIDQDLIINDQYLLFGPHAKLVIKDGVTLQITSTQSPQPGNMSSPCEYSLNQSVTTLQAGCCEMWDGIYIEQGGELLVNASIVRDAYNAIVSESGAPFEVRNGTVLHENLKHIVIEPFSGTHPGVVENSFMLSIGSMVPPSPNSGWTDIAIDVEPRGTVNIGVPNFGGPANANWIIGAGTAIDINAASANINNNTIFNHPLNPNQPGLGVNAYINTQQRIIGPRLNVGNQTPNDFLLCVTGVAADQYARVNISDNTFTQQPVLGTAIHVSNSPRPNIIWPPGGTPMPDPNDRNLANNNMIDNGETGIHFNNCRNFLEVTDNRITLSAAPPAFNGIFSAKGGVWVFDDFTVSQNRPASLFSGNVITNAYSGFQIWGRQNVTVRENTISIIQPPDLPTIRAGINLILSDNSTLDCNIISGTSPNNDGEQFGIQVGTSPGTDIQCNPVSDLGRGFNYSGPSQPTQMRDNDITDTEIGVDFENQGAIGWQFGITGGGIETFDNEWLGTGNNTIRNLGGGPQAVFIVRDNGGPGTGFDPDNIWNLTSGFVFVNQLTPNNNPPFDCNPGCGFAVPSFAMQHYAQKIAQDSIAYPEDSMTHRWWARRNLYYTLLQHDSIVETDTILNGFMDDFIGESTVPDIDELKLRTLDFLNENTDESYEDLVSAISAVGSSGKAETVSAMEANLRQYLLHYLGYKYTGDTSQVLLEKIWAIARQCVFEGGPSVVEARAFLFTNASDAVADTMEVYGYAWADTCEAEGGGASKMSGNEKPQPEEDQSLESLSYKIIPNLYKGNRTGQVTLGNEEQGFVEIFTVSGVLLQSKILLEGTNTINLNGLSKGIFIYKILINGEVNSNDKLVIIE